MERLVLDELEKEYQEALKDIKLKIQQYMAMPETKSRIYHRQYQENLKKQIEAALEKLHSDEYTTINQYLHDSYTDAFVGTMYDLHIQGVPVIAPIDQNAVIKAVMTDTRLNKPLYQKLGIDVNKLKRAISNEISRGIASGLLYEEIARNIQFRTNAPIGRAKTIARTEGHRIQQASAEDARQVAKSKGADVVKQWDATLDGKTRTTHRQLDGQIRETDEQFELGNKKAMYPGDFGDPAEDCNCRCVALTRSRSALDADELSTLKDRAKAFGLDKTDSFKDFEKKYLKAAEEVAKEPAITFVPAKTKGEAETFAKAFADNVDYKGVSLENANIINEQLAVLTSKYPINKLEKIAAGGRGSMSANYNHLLISRNKIGKVLEEGHENFLRMQQDVIEELKTIKERFAGKKRLPFDVQKNVEKLENGLRFKRWGVHGIYEDHVKWVVTHEYGHIVSDQYFGLINGDSANPNIKTNWSIRSVSERWKKIFEKAYREGDVYNISQYGSTNHKEFFAECFVAREIGEKLPDYIEEFMAEVSPTQSNLRADESFLSNA
jgi:hypothetical protein